MPHNVPNRPWSQVGADLFELNRQHYFLLVHYYSTKITVQEVVKSLCTVNFLPAMECILDALNTASRPQFYSGEFRIFAKDYNVQHHTSIPLYLQSMAWQKDQCKQ